MALYELSRCTSTLLPSVFVRVVSKPLPVMSVVTGPAVPPPTLLTAAAWALAAAAPVSGFSASSCAAVPCAGPLNAGRACVLDRLDGVLLAVCDEAAPAIAEPTERERGERRDAYDGLPDGVQHPFRPSGRPGKTRVHRGRCRRGVGAPWPFAENAPRAGYASAAFCAPSAQATDSR